MKKLFFVLFSVLLGLLSTSGWGQTFKDRCEHELRSPQVVVNKVPLPTVKTVRVPSLAYATHYVHADSDISKKATLGYTEVVRFVEYEVTMDYLRDAKTGKVCARAGVQLDLGYRSVDINIVEELADNSCAYDSVFNHELGHVKIYSQYLDELSLRADSLFAKEFSDIVWGADVEEVAAQLSKKVEASYIPKVHTEFSRVQVRHTNYDSPAEQLRIMSSCNGDIVAILTTALKAPL